MSVEISAVGEELGGLGAVTSVKDAQDALIRLYGGDIPVSHSGGADGAMGPATVESLKIFQARWNDGHPTDRIAVDGKLGPATKARLDRALSGDTVTPVVATGGSTALVKNADGRVVPAEADEAPAYPPHATDVALPPGFVPPAYRQHAAKCGFLCEYKVPLFIGAGALAVGTIAYLVLRHPRRAAAVATAGLGSTRRRRRARR